MDRRSLILSALALAGAFSPALAQETVRLRGTIEGQPTATLVPISENRFKVVVDGAQGEIFAQFDMAEGKVKSMTIEQSGMKLALTPKQ